jgi:hypothetical protein
MVAGIRSSIGLLLILGVPVAAGEPQAAVKVTQRYLEPLCLNGVAVKPGERHWRLAVGTHSLAFTMRNDARQGVELHQSIHSKGAPGVATVSFTVEADHKYEVEVRASALAFSSRVWERGEWKPVVRDRTADRLISGEPLWSEAGCQP